MTANLRTLIADNGYAMSFQSLGQYRTALLKEIDAARRSPVADAAGELPELPQRDSALRAEPAGQQEIHRPSEITIPDGPTLRYEARTTGKPGWLMYHPNGELIRAMSVPEVALIEASLAARCRAEGGNTSDKSGFSIAGSAPEGAPVGMEAATLSDADLYALRRVIECTEKLDERPRPMCRDCADENGTCPNSGLECDMRALIANAKAAYNRLAAPTSASAQPADQNKMENNDE